MTQQQIEQDLLKFISQNIMDSAVHLHEDTVLKDAGVDSFSLVEVILFIERKYGLVMPEDTVHPDNFRTVKILATVLHQLLNA